MKFELDALVRPNIKNLTAYSSARKEFSGAGEIFLDANENSFGTPPLERNYNRYPDPLQSKIKGKLAEQLGLSDNEIFVGNGSDEAIDLLLRAFCRPGIDEVIITPPTYGMYEVSANINDIEIKKVLLSPDFELVAKNISEQISDQTKLIFLCSPNNPTGNSLERGEVLEIADNFRGILVVDEAYIDFSNRKSFVSETRNHPNLIVLQTFSKAWGLAGLRIGLALGNSEIVAYLNKIKPPYNISEIAQEALLKALKNSETVTKVAAQIIKEREHLTHELNNLSFVLRVFPSDANFLLIKTVDANGIYRFLIRQGIIVRNRSNVELCENCLRITVGTRDENQTLLKALGNYQ